MTTPTFHIAVNGPVGTTFPSFPSSALEKGDPSKISLAHIRNRCSISSKLFFTFDGNSRIADSTILSYYMSLTSEGQEILDSAGLVEKPDAIGKEPNEGEKPNEEEKANEGETPKKEGERKEGAEPKEVEEPKKGANGSDDKSVPKPRIRIFTLKVTNGKVESSPLTLPPANAALAKLLGGISESSLKRGVLPTFTDRELASLKGNYAAVPGTAVGLPEPSELTEVQWDIVFNNNRALHGFYYDFKTNIMIKASKRAFKLKGAAPLGKPPTDESDDTSKQYVPPFPPYYISDDANVNVTEIRSQFQHTLAKEGFSSIAIDASIGGGTNIPVSVSASFEQEHASITQTRNATDVNALVVTYNFPRVIVELDTESLELTEQCREDALRVSDKVSKDKFFRDYGTIFATRFTLGGYLYSTRHVTSTETSTLDQVKDSTRMAAGISIQSPKASGSFNVAKVDSKSQEDGTASLFQDAHLTWDARGGDTLLCSNPPAWASTVKNYKLWRLMNQQRLVKMEGLIQDIDIIAYRQLDDPSAVNNSPIEGGNARVDVIKDASVNAKARVNLMDALTSSSNNILANQIQKYYEDGKFETAVKIRLYDTFYEHSFPTEEDSLIEDGTKWGALDLDQKLGFGLYMASLGVIQVV